MGGDNDGAARPATTDSVKSDRALAAATQLVTCGVVPVVSL